MTSTKLEVDIQEVSYFLLIVSYLFFNFLELLLMGLDKKLAQWKWERHRISEKCLLIFGFLGPIGGWSGMHLFKHKTAPGKYLFRQNMRNYTIAHICILALVIYNKMKVPSIH